MRSIFLAPFKRGHRLKGGKRKQLYSKKRGTKKTRRQKGCIEFFCNRTKDLRYWKPFLLLWACPPSTTGLHLTRPGHHSQCSSKVCQVWCISMATEVGDGSRERPAGSDRPEIMGLEELIPYRDHSHWAQHPPYCPGLPLQEVPTSFGDNLTRRTEHQFWG